MGELFALEVFLPSFVLGVFAWFVPVGLARIMKEGLRPLMMLALIATLVLFALSTVVFYVLYLSQGISAADLAQFSFAENLVFFGRLGLSSALVWVPILLLSIMNRPRYWVNETW